MFIVVALAGLGASAQPDGVRAIPDTKDHTLPVSAGIDVLTRFGPQRVILTGTMALHTGELRQDGGDDVVDLELRQLYLTGASPLGRVTVGAGTPVSLGEIRGLQPGALFPASSFLDLYADVEAPDTPVGPLELHNETALRLVPWANGGEASLAGWPPLGVQLRLVPVFGVDNDGDGLVDEDTADEDGDAFVNEDRPGPDPLTPGVKVDCGDDADCDGFDGEDPPPELCSPAVCDTDGDGLMDEDPNCVPLFNQAGTSLKLGLCVSDVTLDVAPLLPTFSVGRGGPSPLHPAALLGLTPAGADLSGQAPFVRIACAALGLTVDGCDDGSDGTQDDVSALSFGHDLAGRGAAQLFFSVTQGAQGAPGSAVEQQRNCPPSRPGLAPEAEADVFVSSLDGANEIVFDGNGPIGSCAPAFPLGLVEAAITRDRVDAFDQLDALVVDEDGDGVPDRPVFFSLDADSPSLHVLGFDAGDVLVTVDGRTPSVFASSSQLGLRPGDEIAAVCVQETGDSLYGAGDVIYLGLTPRSPSLAAVGAGPGDILAPGTPLPVVARAGSLGLAGTDALGALSCEAVPPPSGASGDVSCDGAVNEIDAQFVLQYEAGLIPALPCPEGGDTSADGLVNSIDALLILQFNAGLIGRLPR
jgi:hypothetical protein